MGERLTGSAHQHLRTVSVEGAGSRFKAQGTADTLKPLAGAPHRAKRHLSRRAKQAGDARAFLFSLCVHGHFDPAAYDTFLAGTLEDRTSRKPTARRAGPLAGGAGGGLIRRGGRLGARRVI